MSIVATARPPEKWPLPCPVGHRSPAIVPARSHRAHIRTLALKILPRYGIERHLCLVSGAHALERILLKSGRQAPVVLMHEHHDGTQRRGHDVHAGAQRHLCHIAGAWCPNNSLVEIILRLAQFGLNSGDCGVHTAYLQLHKRAARSRQQLATRPAPASQHRHCAWRYRASPGRPHFSREIACRLYSSSESLTCVFTFSTFASA